jgi:hypothetical protein
VLLSIAAVGVVLGFALGVEAFRADVVGKAFGWRQLLSLVAVAAVTISSVPLVLDLLDGRWLAPVSDVGEAVSSIQAKGRIPNERTLWIGDADAMGTSGWRLGDGMKFALTDGVDPTFSSLFPQGPGDGERQLRSELVAAAEGGSVRLGTRLAPYGIRYVVVLSRLAPRPYGTRTFPISPELSVVLGEQFDMAQVDVSPGIRVYQNLARLPIRSTTEPAAAKALSKPASVATLVDGPPATEPWSVSGRPPTRYQGKLPVGRSLMVLSTRDEGWRLVGDESAKATALFGWASTYDTGAGGDAKLEYSTPSTQVVLHVLQLLVLLTLPWLRRRRVSEFRVRRARSRSERAAASARTGAE